MAIVETRIVETTRSRISEVREAAVFRTPDVMVAVNRLGCVIELKALYQEIRKGGHASQPACHISAFADEKDSPAPGRGAAIMGPVERIGNSSSIRGWINST